MTWFGALHFRPPHDRGTKTFRCRLRAIFTFGAPSQTMWCGAAWRQKAELVAQIGRRQRCHLSRDREKHCGAPTMSLLPGPRGKHWRTPTMSPLPGPGEVATKWRVRVERRKPPGPSSGLRPPSPASGRRDRIGPPTIRSPLPRPGEVATKRRVRVHPASDHAPHPACGHLLPAGEKGQDSGLRRKSRSPLPRPGEVAPKRRVRVPTASDHAPHPACGHLLPVGEKGHDRASGKIAVTSPETGRGRHEVAGEGRTAATPAPSSGLRPPSPALGRRDRMERRNRMERRDGMAIRDRAG